MKGYRQDSDKVGFILLDNLSDMDVPYTVLGLLPAVHLS